MCLPLQGFQVGAGSQTPASDEFAADHDPGRPLAPLRSQMELGLRDRTDRTESRCVRIARGADAAVTTSDASDGEHPIGASDCNVLAVDTRHSCFDDQLVALHESIQCRRERERRDPRRKRGNRSRQCFQLCKRVTSSTGVSGSAPDTGHSGISLPVATRWMARA